MFISISTNYKLNKSRNTIIVSSIESYKLTNITEKCNKFYINEKQIKLIMIITSIIYL